MTIFNKYSAVIFNIQRFSVHDGPGIRTIIFLKGCPLKCLWCSNPEGQEIKKDLIYIEENCIHCYKCINACKNGALTIQNEKIKWCNNLCNFCKECTKKCPSNAIKIYGETVNVEYIMNEIKKDYLFYKNSGGGVTFSGGEPLMWPDFISEISKKCKKEKINVALETSGSVPWKNFERVLENINIVLFDVKHMDPVKHKKICGDSNTLILKNLKKIIEIKNLEIIIRFPIIPGLNDSKKNVLSTAKFISTLNGKINRVDLLPYFKYHINKYEKLGKNYSLTEIDVPNEDKLNNIKKLMQRYKLNIQIGG